MRFRTSSSWRLRARRSKTIATVNATKKSKPKNTSIRSRSSGGYIWLTYGNANEPTRNTAVRLTSRRRKTSSAAALVKPHAGHWSLIRSAPQSKHRVIDRVIDWVIGTSINAVGNSWRYEQRFMVAEWKAGRAVPDSVAGSRPWKG